MSYSQQFERNLGFFSSDEQDKLQSSSIAIAGAGGDGGMLAVQLARLGIGEIRLADPDPFEIENINRQAVCNTETIGVNKARAVGQYLQKINPEANISIFEEGITPQNTAEFLKGADLLIDETEFTIPAIGVGLAREARNISIPNLTAFNIGFGAVVTTYKPEGHKLEETLGIDENMTLEEVAKVEVPLARWLPYLPGYGDIQVLEKVARQEKPAPSVAPGVAIAAGAAATQAVLNLLHGENKRKAPVYASNALVIDVMEVKARIIKYNRTSHYRYLGQLLVRNMLKLNPKTSY
ncbi:ThiF family adenylyltransferase [Candidatus Saccharibacteria bacterium]|nr:ThiF family adenylyltransferase [Candidatus Saccharibacteria bacterium]